MIYESSSVETEARFFFRSYLKGTDIEKLRADIRPGAHSDSVNRELRLRVLERFERLVQAEQMMGVRV